MTNCGATAASPRATRASPRPPSSTRSRSRRPKNRKRGVRGSDGGQKVTGRRRHIPVDTLGSLLAVVVHAADIQDPDGATLVFDAIRGRFRRLRLVWAEGIYRRIVARVARWRPARPIRLEVVERTLAHGFAVLPRRWVVERTFARLGRCRRLSKGYEATTSSSEAFIKLAG